MGIGSHTTEPRDRSSEMRVSVSGGSQIPTPEEWFRNFADIYRTELATDGGYLDHAFRRAKVRKRLGTSEAYFRSGESPEWTALMSVLLAQAAKRMGFRQEWEWLIGRKRKRRIDLVWHPRSQNGPIQVLIEHESQWHDARAAQRLFVRSPEIAPGALRVLLTYGETSSRPIRPRDWAVMRKEILVGLGSRTPPPGGFLVCLGPEDWRRETGWSAYEWRGGRRFRRLQLVTVWEDCVRKG